MYPYKVVFLENNTGPKKKNPRGQVDGYHLSKDLEALLIEQDKLGYALVSIVPVTGNVSGKYEHPTTVTIGFTVTFKEKDLKAS